MGGQAEGGSEPSAPPNYEDELVDVELDAELDDAGEDEAGRQASEDVELHLGEAGRNWERPPAPALDERTDSLVFQQLDVDYYNGTPDKQLYHTDLTEAPILRIFGVTEAGNSVCLFVHGFEPYFYIEAPSGWGPDECDILCNELNARLPEACRPHRNTRWCLKASIEQKQSIWHYQPQGKKAFIRLTFATPIAVPKAKSILQGGMNIASIGFSGNFMTYESDVLFALRYMIDQSIVGCNWLELPPGSYRCTPASLKVSHCQLEVHANYERVVSHPAEGEWVKLSRFRILSVDIECAGRKGHFPEAEKDPVIQIASMVTVQGESTPIVKNVMTLKSCAAIVGAEVMSFNSEAEMLKRWRDLVVESDPDVIIGYNTSNFDLPYLIDRANTLKVAEFPFWGRLKKQKLRMRDASFSSKAHGTHDYKEITVEGRIQFDVMWAIMRDHKLSSYSLNAVSAHFLGEQKEDVHHSIISDLQNGNDETRRRLAVYCLKDAYLPQRLVDKLMFMVNYMEMARVTGVPMSFLLSRGQSIKVYSQILRKARQRCMVVPNLPKSGVTTEGVGYEGATVLDAKAGFYRWPIATLDFASLYPSIMMAHNICYSTLVPKTETKQMAPEELVKSPSGDCFVRPSKCKGLLPEILEELLGARKRAKADLKKATDPFMKAVLDGRQLALKVSANSVYGFTGATVGKLPCLEISASVTSFGRDMIMHTREMVQRRYCKANGYDADCTVIYGDTDSVMVDFHEPDCAKAMELGRAAAAEVSATFTKPIKLEFEKVYFPYLLVSKKRYAGLLWTNPDKHDKMDTKGIETVRRDNCLLVRNVISTCLDKILIDKDVAGAKAFVCSTISDLLMNRMDLSLLVITKGLTQDEDKYKSKNAHAELAKKMRKRDPATAPNVGDRVPYVIIKAAKDAKAHEKAEDPIYVLEHGLPIDSQHYLEHHLKLPLTRLFEPLMKNSNELLSGDHTRSISLGKASQAAGGIMKFAKVQLSCLACKSPLGPHHTSLCPNCQSKEAEIYQRMLGSVNELETQFGGLWSQCQRCQGSLHQDVLCTSRDCPIFYRRKKVQKDLTEAHSLLSRFQDW